MTAVAPTLPPTTVLSLPDGRDLAWLELGDPEGRPVVAIHGTPGSRLQLALQDPPVPPGIRLILPDRPGYGHATYAPDRRLVDWPDDVAALVDHLGIDRFSVCGVSGGGPHAAACARFLADRIDVAAIVSGVAPLGAVSDEGTLAVSRLATGLARAGRRLNRPLFAAMTSAQRRWPEAVADRAGGALVAPDAAVFERPAVRAITVLDWRRASPTTALAAAQDFDLFAAPWGFALEDIAVPTHVWHGDADRNVPVAHGRYQADRIPGAVLHECPGEGHLLVMDHRDEILTTLTAPPG